MTISYSQECSVIQGFNVNPNRHQRFGYIDYLRIGDLEFVPDIHANVPVDGAKSQHVGVISDLFWQDTAKVSPITLDFRLSVSNQQKLMQYTQGNNFNSDVLVEFASYEYDPNAHTFYSSFNTDKETIEGDLEVLAPDSQLAIYVSKDPETDVQSPVNYFAYLSIVPTAKAQQLISATSVTIKEVLPWGVSVV
ncbi:hypothetical protein [Piscirickettsia litoralis]|uniref:Uncharacterized protein n=1 Tax=Piscirickettsia litoralis TaxID=1891921 RepID=A0ABX3A4G5_9GAMM|nr:hypothetical protein [Piscirickettsia litoralis]ODN43338.1 hypothetical protein BGC07_10895 [Piscirickettsia litoralis]